MKNKRRRGSGEERRSSIARTSDVEIGATAGLILIPDDEGSPRGRERARAGHGEVKRLPARGVDG